MRRVSPVVLAFISGGLLFGCAGWFSAHSLMLSDQSAVGVLYQSSNYNNYQYIDPLLACEIGDQTSFDELKSLKAAVVATVDSSIKAGEAKHVSVYFRTLKTAHWFDVNSEQGYAPASLLKIFVMMAYYKESRDLNDPNLLNRQIPFKGSANPADDNPGAIIPHLENGHLYSINSIIEQMIMYSDNDALNTLIGNFDTIGSDNLSEIFSDLQITSPLTDEQSYSMTVDQYSKVFRVLYGSTYLSRRLSEQALAMLAKAQFKIALAAGVPSTVAVAHKFGITTLAATTSTPAQPELHDCGIIYYPDHPYILCVMTQGSDFTQLAAVIKSISAQTYQKMEEMYSK